MKAGLLAVGATAVGGPTQVDVEVRMPSAQALAAAGVEPKVPRPSRRFESRELSKCAGFKARPR